MSDAGDLMLYAADMADVEAAKEADLLEALAWDVERRRIRNAVEGELRVAEWARKGAPRLPGVGSCYDAPNPDLWFSDRPTDRLEAALICQGCPMNPECADSAAKNGEAEGTWAGEHRDGFSTATPRCGVCDSTDWDDRPSGRRCRGCHRRAERARRAARRAAS